MTDVLFYILLKLSLTHTPTNVTAYAVQVRSLPYTCSPFNLFFLQLLVPCADRQRLHVFTYHLHDNLDKVCWISQPIYGFVFVQMPVWRLQHSGNRERPCITPRGVVVNSLARIIMKVCDSVWRCYQRLHRGAFLLRGREGASSNTVSITGTLCHGKWSTSAQSSHSLSCFLSHWIALSWIHGSQNFSSCAAIMSEATTHLQNQDASHRRRVQFI